MLKEIQRLTSLGLRTEKKFTLMVGLRCTTGMFLFSSFKESLLWPQIIMRWYLKVLVDQFNLQVIYVYKCANGNFVGFLKICTWNHLGPYSLSLGVSSKLVINQIIPEDDAIYQCQAENEQGSVLTMARLIVVMSEDRPSAPRNIRADTVSSSAILLAWERPLYNSDKVIAYSVHYMKAEGKQDPHTRFVVVVFFGNRNSTLRQDFRGIFRNPTFCQTLWR